MPEIKIFHIKKHTACKLDYYIGRPSLLGNPFTHIQDKKTLAEFVVATRNEAVDRYKEYAETQYQSDKVFRDALNELVALYKSGQELHLLCWCHPKRCHA